MTEQQTFVLDHSWPLFEAPRHFELGHVLSCAVTDIIEPSETGGLNLHHAGCWECDLSDSSLVWSGGVFDIFGLPRDAAISREECVGFYCEDSRAKMERLRAHSIKHRRGFTVDVQIRPAVGGLRWMRLVGAPICSGDRAIRLHGLKIVI